MTTMDLTPDELEPEGLPTAVLRLPGVYRPQEDTRLLTRAIAAAGVRRGARVLDLCTGTGAQAVAAAKAGAGSVTAVDVSRRALAAAWLNGVLNRAPVRVRHGGVSTVVGSGPYDVVVANPPYVPCPTPTTPSTRAWDAGPDGRAVLDELCPAAAGLLRPGGFLLLVHSEVADVPRSLSQLQAGGLRAEVVSRTRVPFGPVMRERAPYLLERGLIGPDEDTEIVTVLRADRVA
ncbi:putative methyltransferase [Actinokineospora spheciospongiae]|uniref:Putative methyltransferase n=1 Tax=Actinokineospora spheciospongiae TaxID=909613 RepID=W7INA8_9PSEU|nr:methyltransferase [Actinokineospora spheciospongiae]EWC58237.1 putative methyltransferase [Actinokineospora spheciospongiae]